MSVDVLDRDSAVDADLLSSALAAMHAELDALLAADMSAVADDALFAALLDAERLRRRLAAVDHRLISQFDRRGLAQAKGHRGPASLLVSMLRVSRAEAHARVRAAEDCGPRISFQSEALPPLHSEVSTAQASGVISPEQARIITGTVNALPDHVTVDAAAGIRDALLDLAEVREP